VPNVIFLEGAVARSPQQPYAQLDWLLWRSRQIYRRPANQDCVAAIARFRVMRLADGRDETGQAFDQTAVAIAFPDNPFFATAT
jgi:hypothetical protein